MTRKTVALVAVLIISSIRASATIINIPADYPAIQEGINASVDGDTVLVQPGTYVENINFNGHNIVLGSLFLTTADTSYILNTVINGQQSASVVTFASGENSTAEIKGFAIYNGLSTTNGGGIFCDHSSPKISNNIVVFCEAWDKGGGIYCGYSDAEISNNQISSNFAEDGGGIGCYNSNSVIENNLIENDSAFYFGGGIYCQYSNPVIKYNIINANKTFYGGGAGIGCYESSPIIDNNRIVNNIADGDEFGGMGGGILCMSNSAPVIIGNRINGNWAMGVLLTSAGGGIYSQVSQLTLLNNIITFNSAEEGGGLYLSSSYMEAINNNFVFNGNVIYCIYNSYLRIVNSIIYDNISGLIVLDSSVADISFSDIQGGWTGAGNINVEPYIFSFTGQLMSIQCGFNVDSPCIDAGDPNILDSLLDCSWGLGGPRSDMGAYGGGDSLITSIFGNIPPIPDQFILLQNYPNPFNDQTTIRFVLPKSQNVQLTVYDLLGRQIEVLIDEYREAGVYNITFDASSLSSGVYFYRLRAGDVIETKRMVLLK